MSTIIVTGGAGFIGSHTVVKLIEEGHNPLIVDNFVNSNRSVIDGIERIVGRQVDWREGDCCDRHFMAGVFDSLDNVQGVIHFAAYKAVGESVTNPGKYYDNNVNSLLVLMDIMKEQKVSNLVFSSSCTVYGQPDELPVTEDTPKKTAVSPYGNTKQICEEIIEDLTKANPVFNAVSLRYFNPIGAHSTSEIGELPIGVPSNLVPFLTQAVAGIRESLTVFGSDYNTHDGSCIRDYIHVDDLASAHVQAIRFLENNESVRHEVFNVGTGQGHSVLDVINQFEEGTGQKVKYKLGLRRDGDVEQVWADTSKIRKHLDWFPKNDLKTALIDAWNWQKKLMQNA